MLKLGQTQELRINRFTDNGAYLICDEGQEVLLPNKYLETEFRAGDEINVFVYKDSEDRIVATTEVPFAVRGEFACLQVKDVNKMGAFLDWGLEKDLLLPYSEQNSNAKPGQWLLVFIAFDPKSDRLYASAKLQPFLSNDIDLEEGSQVDLLIAGTRELGTQVVINDQHLGMLYHNEVFEEINKGERKTGFVKKLRDDGKIDVSLRPPGLANLESGAHIILEKLKANGGMLNLHDKSDPDEIQKILQMSKKSFKRSLGILYKQRLIKLTNNAVELI